MTNLQNLIEELKGRGLYYAAGALAAHLGHDDNYGCHYGMRSELEYARAEFKAGWREVALRR